MSTLRDAALEYARSGWPVFPCAPNKKTPLTSKGFKDATRDPKRIREWWDQHPQANIGIATGESHLGVIDGDVKHGHDPVDSLLKLMNGHHSLPETRRSKTPSGGWHLYFTIPDGIEISSSAGKLGPGLDVRAAGGYVVAPPSVVDGRAYEWVNGFDEPIATLPDWLAEVLTQTKQPSVKGGVVGTMVPKGQRNVYLTSLGGTMRVKGMAEQAIEAALLAENAARCDPPLPEREVKGIVRSIAKYESGDDIQPFPISLVIGVTDFLAEDIPQRQWVVEGVLLKPALAMIFGWRGRGKTWLALSMAVAIAAGEPFLHWDCHAKWRVLYVDGEMPAADLQQRARLMVGLREDVLLDLLSSEFFYRSEQQGFALNNHSHQARFLALLEQLEREGRRPDVIFFDNLSSLAFGIDENSNSEMDSLLAFLVKLRHLGYTVVVIHHAGKGGDQRGASRREDLLDVVIKLAEPSIPSPDGNAKFTLEFVKVRSTRSPQAVECELVTDKQGFPVWATKWGGGAGEKPMWLRILKFIADKRPARQKDITDAFGIKPCTVTEHLKKLRAGKLVEPGSLVPTKSGLAYLKSAFPEDDNAPDF